MSLTLLGRQLDLVYKISLDLIQLLLEGLSLFSEALFGIFKLLVIHSFQVAGRLQLFTIQCLFSSFEIVLSIRELLAFSVEHLFHFSELLYNRVV